ncbi:MAG: hypothetical protein SFY81_03255 [Verrucomicrobiota bacterium]|nr:hypothetical protein [Verrucomicrobiota bacterium]
MNVLGATAVGTNVTVNGDGNVYRKGTYFRKEIGTTNSSAVWLPLTVLAGLDSELGNLFIPGTPESYNYDDDGNLTSDGRFTRYCTGRLCYPV